MQRTLIGLALAALIASAGVASEPTGPALPRPAEPFKGTIAPIFRNAKADWPALPRAPKTAPNILLVMTDDAGFGSSSTFGGPIPTPNLDALAARGLRYNRFHTTGICSPTRASLLTGRNPHAVATSTVVDIATGFPGANGEIPKSAATVAEILRQNGFNTAMFGKHHNTPGWNLSAAGPFDLWPTGLGFEYFYGFMGGDTDQFHPHLYRGTNLLEGPQVQPGETLDHALIGDAIRWLSNQEAADPTKPWLLYLAPGSMHAPHQVPKAWADRFKGQFDKGWDRVRADTLSRQKRLGIVPPNTILSARPPELAPWESLSPEVKRVNARMMEIAAANLAYQDAQFGRLLAAIDKSGERDNTLIIFIEGDNGASGEGGPDGFSNEHTAIGTGIADNSASLITMADDMGGPKNYGNYPAGWAWAMNTPFPYMKQVASHRGGVGNGMVISWPARISGTGVRQQFGHVNDIMPTLLDVAGVEAPSSVNGVAQQRIDGTSLTYSFANANAAEQHKTQYFEIMAARSVYHDGWWANTRPRRMPWQAAAPPGREDSDYVWELYDLRRDFSQSRDLAKANPAKLAAMQALFDAEAKRNNVYPIDQRFVARGVDGLIARGDKRRHFAYWNSQVRVAQTAAPSLGGQSFRLTVKADLTSAGQSGVLVATGSRFSGWSFYLKDGKPMVVQSFTQQAKDQFRLGGGDTLPAGPVTIDYVFTADAMMFMTGGVMRILVNGKQVAQGRIDRTIVRAGAIGETFDIGRDTGVPVTDDYADEGVFEGGIDGVEVTLGQ
jgi:arylsulfatase A-like enzyme